MNYYSIGNEKIKIFFWQVEPTWFVQAQSEAEHIG